MIKTFLRRAGKKLKQLAGPRKKQDKAVSEPAADLQAKQQPFSSPGKREGNREKPAQVNKKQPGESGKYRRSKPRKRKPRWTLERFPVDPVPGKSRFHDFKLPLGLMHAIADLDFKYCTPIQEKALPESLAGSDLIGRASTGTGKSAVFLISVFARLLKENRAKKGSPKPKPGLPRALIIAPTRELVMQIAKDAKNLAKYTPLHIGAVYGGTDYKKQQEMLTARPVDVLVATPGRLLDYVFKKVVHLKNIGIMVIDEADRMLDMGFIPDVQKIVYKTRPKEQRQTMLFSATVTEDVKRLASQWCIKPIFIESEPEQVAVETVEQIVYMTTSEEKYSVLYNLITTQEHERILVFTNMKSEARKLNDRLRRNNINCTLLTGDVPQKKRMARLESFRAGKVKVMIATDVAGRGIHIDGISHVVNYTLPYEPEDYVHRIGRTGRAGETGISISFACEEGGFYLPDIEEYIGTSLTCVNPTDELLVKPPKGSHKGGIKKKGSRKNYSSKPHHRKKSAK